MNASMTDSRNPSPIAWYRPLLALVAGLALALGMAAPHDMAVELAGVAARVEIAETAVHPDAPAHAEDAEFKLHPACVACLLQLGSSTVLGRPPVLATPLPRLDRGAATVARFSPAAPPLSGSTRAPPFSSP